MIKTEGKALITQEGPSGGDRTRIFLKLLRSLKKQGKTYTVTERRIKLADPLRRTGEMAWEVTW